MADIYRHIVERDGHSVVIVAEGANEAVSKFAHARFFGLENEEHEIVIADNRLPYVLGIEVSKELCYFLPYSLCRDAYFPSHHFMPVCFSIYNIDSCSICASDKDSASLQMNIGMFKLAGLVWRNLDFEKMP